MTVQCTGNELGSFVARGNSSHTRIPHTQRNSEKTGDCHSAGRQKKGPFLTSDWCLPRRNVDSNRVDRHLLSQYNPSFATIMNWSRGLHLCMYYLVMGVISFALVWICRSFDHVVCTGQVESSERNVADTRTRPPHVDRHWRIHRVRGGHDSVSVYLFSCVHRSHKTQKSLFWIVLIGSSVIWVVITICVILSPVCNKHTNT